MGNLKTNPLKNQHPDQDTLQAYLDQALVPGSSREVEEHLESCPACREKIAVLKKMFTRLETLPEIPLHKDFSPGVLEMIRDQKQLSRSLTWTLVFEGLAAGAILGLIIPALQFTPWIPRLMNVQLEIEVGLNIFLAQLFSSWILWWAQLKFSFTQLVKHFQVPLEIPAALPAPWIWILLAAGLGILINGLLLKTNFSHWNTEQKR
ncbi:MAG: zf-HC2 domain-containing protein [Anaerolineales bacterium]|nr:zf-HC2 domain-containing protein [Anaerolineales bacterium]